ncbi:hypothetical protein LCGC14_0417680 [marine sediment metagenome]|uniref:Methyltransferase type 11 domain-containing protein n=1 Tax=marine sediment metagenome TaxID=412755 RepID=A0A0F9T9S0_9ZZZZ
MSKWREDLESWLGTLDISGTVLDVGGAQKPIKGRTGSWYATAYDIWDIENFGKSFVTKGRVDGPIPSTLFPADNVFCLETLMYTIDPVRALMNLATLTKRDLYISNPLEGYPETKPKGTDMLRLMPNWFEHVLKDSLFEIVELKIAYAHDAEWGMVATMNEGYKIARPQASGILIHARRV